MVKKEETGCNDTGPVLLEKKGYTYRGRILGGQAWHRTLPHYSWGGGNCARVPQPPSFHALSFPCPENGSVGDGSTFRKAAGGSSLPGAALLPALLCLRTAVVRAYLKADAGSLLSSCSHLRHPTLSAVRSTLSSSVRNQPFVVAFGAPGAFFFLEMGIVLRKALQHSQASGASTAEADRTVCLPPFHVCLKTRAGACARRMGSLALLAGVQSRTIFPRDSLATLQKTLLILHIP